MVMPNDVVGGLRENV